MSFFNNFNKENLICAHRGFRKVFVENSLEAFISSLEFCDFIEFDIQFTKDYIPIITHDETLKRCSNISKLEEFKKYKPWYIKDLEFNQIKKLNYKKTKIASLEEFLILAKDKKIVFNLEIKQMHKEINEIKALEVLLLLLKKYNISCEILISSFNHNYLKYISQNSDFSIAVLDEEVKRKDLINYLKDLKAVSYNISKKAVNQLDINALKQNNIEVLVYTVNDQEEIKRLFKQGIKAVFTDYIPKS
ncbi:glycerophosphodiester phosphodiesterase family protein [Malaciobacter mytili]|uniref:glycerophosphodiester phosphodiesterase n=1 Tax=Malaciobacter mytili TaxID=603050 RepID=UPI003BAFA6EB